MSQKSIPSSSTEARKGAPLWVQILVWIGSFIFIFGTLVAAWPERESKETRDEK